MPSKENADSGYDFGTQEVKLEVETGFKTIGTEKTT